MKRKRPTQEQVKRMAAVYNIGQSNFSKREKAGKIILKFADYYTISLKTIKREAKFQKWFNEWYENRNVEK